MRWTWFSSLFTLLNFAPEHRRTLSERFKLLTIRATFAVVGDAPRKTSLRKLGVIAAGKPRWEEEQAETILVDELLVANPQTTYFLQVSGDSMSDAGIVDGDLVIVDAARTAQNNDIVVAEVDGEWTVKQLRKQGENVTLLPANAKYQPIQPQQELRLAGVVTAVVRTLKKA